MENVQEKVRLTNTQERIDHCSDRKTLIASKSDLKTPPPKSVEITTGILARNKRKVATITYF
ncbi:hypothetical protein KIN20_033011 [Parelaphostrongylus tenuis]|uniref:Uncharacterized protein n=1 Tax=Parelaphostrongylus tenuis TaxID=148309 RepID=A0AAD5R7W1_PARTN|nr:hypothetical protein KIN20_033011 [Parelaphostrongylus tenuis]